MSAVRPAGPVARGGSGAADPLPGAAPAPVRRTRERSPALSIGVLASSGVLVALIQTMIVPLLPQFPTIMNVSTATATWLVTATLVAGAVSAPVLGRLGDMYGKRLVLIVALGLIVAGSALGALAPNIAVLIVGRTLQGTSFGVIALGMSLMRDVLPIGRVGAGVGLMSSSLGVGGALGLPFTGLVAQFASWRWLFAVAAVLGAVQIALVAWLVPESRVRTGGRFDVVGALGLGAALVCLLLAISKGSEWGWATPRVLGLLLAALLLLAVWGRRQLRTRHALVDLRISAQPAVLWTNVATLLIGFAMFASFMLVIQILQAPPATGYGFGLSLITAGVVMLPTGLAMVVFSSASARLSASRGPRTTLVLGTTLLGLGSLAVALLPGTIWLLMAATLVGSIGISLAYSALPLLIMRAVPETETAAANSLNTLMRQLGTSSCTAMVAAVSTALVAHSEDGATFPAEASFVIVFVACGIVALVAAGIAALTPAPAHSER